MSQEINDNELQSVTEEEEGEDMSQAGSELEVDKKKKKETKPLKSALKSKSKSKTSKKVTKVETKEAPKQKEKGLNRVSSVQTISSVVADLDNLSREISRTFYKTSNYSSYSSQTSYQTPQFNHDQRAQMREEQYRNNFKDLNLESSYDHRRSDYENSNRFFSQSVQSQQREYQQEYLPPIQHRQYQQEYLPPIQQRMPMHYSQQQQQFEQPYQEREYWNNDLHKSHASFSSTKYSRDYRLESEYSAAPPSSHYHMDQGYATRDTFISAPQKLDIRSLYKNKPKHIMMEQDSELRNGLRPNSIVRPPQATQNYRTKSMIPSASAIFIHRGI